jgi:hypothetical protein
MNRHQRSSSRSTCPGPHGGPLVPVRKQPGLKAPTFSSALLVPVATTGTNGPYKPGPMAFFPPVVLGFVEMEGSPTLTIGLGFGVHEGHR